MPDENEMIQKRQYLNSKPIRFWAIARAVLLLAMVFFETPATAQDSAHAALRTQARSIGRTIAQSCRADIFRYCAGIQSDGGRVLSCLEGNVGRLSQNCGMVIADFAELHNEIVKGKN